MDREDGELLSDHAFDGIPSEQEIDADDPDLEEGEYECSGDERESDGEGEPRMEMVIIPGKAKTLFVGGFVDLGAESLLDLIQTSREVEMTHQDVLVPDRLRKGTYLYRLPSSLKPGDVTRDFLQPWSSPAVKGVKSAHNQRYASFDLTSEGASYRVIGPSKGESRVTLRTICGVLPREERIHRTIAYIYDKDTEKVLSSFIVAYEITANGVAMPYSSSKRQISPSVLGSVTAAYDRRNINGARGILRASGTVVSNRTLYYARGLQSTSQKLLSGRCPASDMAKVDAIAMRQRGIKKTTYTNAAGKACVLITMLFEDAVKVFLKRAPSSEKVKAHHSYVADLGKMSEANRRKHLAALAKQANLSGSLPGLSAPVYIDPTFDLSHALVTPVIGLLDGFENQKSKKRKQVILGCMVHTERTKMVHEQFAREFSALLTAVDAEKRVTSIHLDNEVGLRVYKMGQSLSMANVLLCDVHTRALFEKRGDQDSDSYQLLFGRQEEVNGDATWRTGLLGAMTRESFDAKLPRTLSKLRGETMQWVQKNAGTLFEHHSLGKKLEAGLLQRFCSTNVSESYNSVLKMRITTRMPIEDVMESIIQQHSDEMMSLFQAVSNAGNGTVRVANTFGHASYSSHQWSSMSRQEKKTTLTFHGLGSTFLPPLPETGYQIPLFVLKALGTDLDDLLERLGKLRRASVEDEGYFVFPTDNRHPSSGRYVAVTTDSVNCVACSQKSRYICIHRISVLSALADDHRKRVIAEMKNRWENESAASLIKRTMTAGDGGKGCKRRFGNASAHNNGRNYRAVQSASLSPERRSHSEESTEDEMEEAGSDIELPAHLIRTPLMALQRNSANESRVFVPRRSTEGRAIKPNLKYSQQ